MPKEDFGTLSTLDKRAHSIFIEQFGKLTSLLQPHEESKVSLRCLDLPACHALLHASGTQLDLQLLYSIQFKSIQFSCIA